MKQTIASTVGPGQVVLRVNEQVVGTNATSFDGRFQHQGGFGIVQDADVLCDTVSLCGVQSGFDLGPGRWDDLYVLDLSGSVNNDFLGDMRVEAIFPTAPGSHTDFTPIGSGANWSAVDDATIDGDTTYVSGNAIGQMDTYNFADLSSVPSTIKAFQLSMVMRKDDAGGRIVSTQIRSGGNDYTSGRRLSVGDQYALYLDVWNQNPDGEVAWTGSTINAVQAGVKIVG